MKKTLLGASVFLLLFSSCLKETLDDIDSIKGVKGEPSWGIPMINATLGMDKIVTSAAGSGTTVESDPSGRLVLKLKGSDSSRHDSYFEIPVLAINEEVRIPAPAIPAFNATGSFTGQVNEEKQVNFSNGERIERVLIKEGSLQSRITSEFLHNINVRITYPGITRNGQALVDSFEIRYNGTVPQVITRSLTIDGYLVDMTKNGTTVNVIPYVIEATITRNGNNTVLPTDRLIFEETFNVRSYSRADGYFGRIEVLDYQEVASLSMFDKKLDGNVFIKEPLLRITVENELGMPVTGKITEIFVESGSGNKVPVIIDQLRDTFHLNYSTIPGRAAVTEYIISKDNSNIEDVLSSAPQKITYNVSFTGNSDGVVKDNVLTDNSKLKVTSNLELPFDLRILHYVMEETGEFDFSSMMGNYDTAQVEIQWAELTTESSNELPLNSFMQVYFEDSAGTRLDSMFNEPYRVAGAEVDAQGEVLRAGRELATTYMEKARFDRVRKATRYRIHVRLRTSESNGTLPFVTFYEHQKVRARIGIKVKAKARVTF